MSSFEKSFAVRVPKTAELVSSNIRNRIVRRQLRDGEALPPEPILMKQFAVSRPTLREAFRILESEGLIEVRRGARGGARVRTPEDDVVARYAGLLLQYRGTTVSDLFDARARLEAPAARMLASLRSRKNIVERLAASAREHGREPLNPALAPAFHRLVVELTGNQSLILLTGVVERVAESAEVAWERTNPPPPRDAKAAHVDHERLVELIADGDPDEAEAFWYQHLNRVSNVLQRLYGGPSRRVVDVLE
jgi:DNA-binding FadR family transcriptional regulator